MDLCELDTVLSARVLSVYSDLEDQDRLEICLQTDGYGIVSASDTADVHAIIADVDRLDVAGTLTLQRVTSSSGLGTLPVFLLMDPKSQHDVLNTALGTGVYYYLNKPYDPIILRAMVKAALGDASRVRHVQEMMQQKTPTIYTVGQSSFRFRTLQEATHLASFVAGNFPNPKTAAYGILEMLINAIEHGNLEISYQEKTALVMAGRWQEEVERRLSLSKYAPRVGELWFESGHEKVQVRIVDQGKGFEYARYLQYAPERAFDPHGRGIATAVTMSFDQVEYVGCGNQVICSVWRQREHVS